MIENPSTDIKPSNVTVMIKPVGALCNLNCAYCYYLPTKSIYGKEQRMDLHTLESIYAGYLPNAGQQLTIAWQGGEPTLAGLDFFKKAIAFQNKYKTDDQEIYNALQTNATTLNDEWCEFFRHNRFLVGVSLDGPAHLHDYYRHDNSDRPTHARVLSGLKLCQKHDVEYNILCVLNDRNIKHPEEVFKYLLNIGSRWLQFIPEVVWEPDPDQPGTVKLADHCPDATAYGKFLCRIFDLWFERYRQRVSVRMFDAMLNKLVYGQMPLCILDGSCHNQLTIEHNGDVFGCDHFVERRWQMAKIGDPDWTNPLPIDGSPGQSQTIHGSGYQPNAELTGNDIHSPADLAERYCHEKEADLPLDTQWLQRCEQARLGAFAARKQRTDEKCEQCQWRPFCFGGCPEHRPAGGDEPNHSIFCEGYLQFYNHAIDRMAWLAEFIRRGQQPPPCKANQESNTATDSAVGRRMPNPQTANNANQGRVKRNAPCPCGSGLKYKQCCGKPA